MNPQTLHDAIEHDQIEWISRLLREKKVQLKDRNFQGEDAVQYFVHHAKKSIPSVQRRIQVVEEFLKVGWSIDDPIEFGRTLLHAAVINDDLKLIQDLLQNRQATIDIKDNTEATPLHLACQLGFKNIVCYLLQQGASKTCVDNTGGTLLHTAAKHGHTAVIAILLSAGVCVNAPNRVKETPLHQCVEHPDAMKIIKQLLAGKADVNATYHMGNSVFHFVVSKTEVAPQALIELLCQVGADLNLKNNRGETHLYQAFLQYVDDLVSEERTETLEKAIFCLMQQPLIECNHIGPYSLLSLMEEDLSFSARLRGLGGLEYRTPQMSEKQVSNGNLLSRECFYKVLPSVLQVAYSLEEGMLLLEAFEGKQELYLSTAAAFLKGGFVCFSQRKALEKLLGICKREIEAKQVIYLNATELLSVHEFVLLEDAVFSFNIVSFINEQIREYFRKFKPGGLLSNAVRRLGEMAGFLLPNYHLMKHVVSDPTSKVCGYIRIAFEGVDLRKEGWYTSLMPEVQKKYM